MVHGERERCVDSHMADGVVFCALDDSARGGGMGSSLVHCRLDDAAMGDKGMGTWKERLCADSHVAAGTECSLYLPRTQPL